MKLIPMNIFCGSINYLDLVQNNFMIARAKNTENLIGCPVVATAYTARQPGNLRGSGGESKPSVVLPDQRWD